MTVSYADYQKLMSGRQQATALKDNQKEQLTMAKVAGLQIEELTNKPDWKLYLDAVEAIRGPALKNLETLKNQVLDEESTLSRKAYHRAMGYADGLTAALNCAKVILKQGSTAQNKLKEEAELNVRQDQETS